MARRAGRMFDVCVGVGWILYVGCRAHGGHARDHFYDGPPYGLRDRVLAPSFGE